MCIRDRYVKEIKANVDNLTTLMISNIDDDRIEIREKIEESLKKLIRETLVQKNGEIYIFLTNEEQEINNAINNESVEMATYIKDCKVMKIKNAGHISNLENIEETNKILAILDN